MRKKSNKQKIKVYGESDPLRLILRTMEIGETVAYPASRCSSVRSMCSSLTFEQNLKFETRRDRENARLVITRTA